MSMNLCFDVKNSPAMVSFPYQTRTKLTYAVLNEKDKEKRIELIRADVNGWADRSDKEKDSMMDSIIALMDSHALELSMI